MIRYPGSKEKIARAIIQRFPESLGVPLFQAPRLEYREPFFGAGAVGLKILECAEPHYTVWINDMDYGLRCLWQSVYDIPEELADRIRAYEPAVATFYQFREEDGRRDLEPLETGFRKLVLHQTSFSGLGAKAGGPIGGREQSSRFNVGCRWNASRLCLKIARIHQLLHRFASVRVTGWDFAKLILDAPRTAFIYADPPYVEKGGELYKHAFTEADHRRLAAVLRACQASWVLSYDDHPLVRELYGSWARIDHVDVTYTTAVATGARRRKNAEVIICP
jgi:DNA adenine methylase